MSRRALIGINSTALHQCITLPILLLLGEIVHLHAPLSPSVLLLLQEDLLDGPHLVPYPNTEHQGDHKGNAEHDVLLELAVLAILREKHTDVDEDELLGQGKERGNAEVPEFDVTAGEDCGGEMRGNDGNTDHEDDLWRALALAGGGMTTRTARIRSGKKRTQKPPSRVSLARAP